MKKYIFCILFFFIYFFLNRFYVDEIRYGLIYNLDVKVNSKIIEVIKIEGRYIDRKIYIKNKENLKFGMYNIKYVWEAKNKGEILEINPHFLNRYRQFFLELIDSSYDDFSVGAISKGIVLGERSYIDKGLMENFNYLGIVHLIAISGLHISIITGFIKNKYLSFSFLTIYSLLVGFTASVKRFYIMRLLSFFNINNKEVYVISLFVLLIYNFSNIYDASFLYTFSTVFVIIYIFPIINKYGKWKYIYFNLCMQLAIMPFSYYYSKNIPIFTFLVNLIMIPIFTILVELVFLNVLFNLLGIKIFSYFVQIYYYEILKVIKYISSIKYISYQVKEVNIYFFIILILISVYIFMDILVEHQKK
ncbi:ComEC/Rec2 family competence protein [Streptobacillus felis]|uniref:ComEC/Rec2 family competence protein n=1 Tax=Streptobacillus felis TaxID=1384509 RepID=A0A7Z0TA82_9FUSO|nr:ComEC/Rec2 family competence protein [Streptobacillus felis]NYV27727.1 ComEC/Rec2 family competence protein [Streptobacillus felis]